MTSGEEGKCVNPCQLLHRRLSPRDPKYIWFFQLQADQCRPATSSIDTWQPEEIRKVWSNSRVPRTKEGHEEGNRRIESTVTVSEETQKPTNDERRHVCPGGNQLGLEPLVRSSSPAITSVHLWKYLGEPLPETNFIPFLGPANDVHPMTSPTSDVSGGTYLDPFTSQSQNNTMTPQEKITGLREIINAAQTAMLTTRSVDGQIHSRAMNPVAPDSETQLTLTFIANNVSHKFEEIQNDSHVNVSFLDPSTTNWASFSGQAKIIDNRDEIKKYWSMTTSAWFGDLGDGVHKGDANDPRVSLIQVVPNEIRYWKANKGKIGRALEVGVGAVTGRIASPGELRTITQEEISLTQGLHTK